MTTKRNIWIPKMSVSNLNRLLTKPSLNNNDKEDLLDFKYFILNDKQSSIDKGLLIEIKYASISNPGQLATKPKNNFWLTNIEEKTKGFISEFYLPI